MKTEIMNLTVNTMCCQSTQYDNTVNSRAVPIINSRCTYHHTAVFTSLSSLNTVTTSVKLWSLFCTKYIIVYFNELLQGVQKQSTMATLSSCNFARG